ncbi:uncharacterized protein BDW47DRAFT_98265 [Aspergillus candidus]|uniref:Uncharacterized protein n=1 Tax=Aspergillus candidus TaxID=41067 RepID=A0A2I2FNX4_ASPCN|nr:hypothetical protein BDW47DRAFT_98265 [Aspergillus candidus]PLB42313.1 hypothetical protein BDW47DRAFT_98265 [Aspergillus candidus]
MVLIQLEGRQESPDSAPSEQEADRYWLVCWLRRYFVRWFLGLGSVCAGYVCHCIRTLPSIGCVGTAVCLCGAALSSACVWMEESTG